MRRLWLVLGGVLLAVVAACSSIHSGTVQRKLYTPGHYYTVEQPQYYLPVQEWADPQWQFLVSNGDQKGWVTVSHAVYLFTKVGQYWSDKPA